jgi:hypothetical protein
MTTSHWIGTVVLHAYPPDIRSERGDEMLGTLLDAHEDSKWAFIRGCISLVLGGWIERARANASQGPGRLVADGLCGAALMWTLLWLRGWHLPPEGYSDVWPLLRLALMISFLIGWVYGHDRIAGMCGLAVVIYPLTQGGGFIGSQGVPPIAFLAQWTVMIGCFAVMVAKPRVRAKDPREALWLLAALALLSVQPIVGAVLLYLGVPVIGIVLLPINPRLAIASAAFWTGLAVTRRLAQTNLGLVTIPVLLLAFALTVAQRQLVVRSTRA